MCKRKLINHVSNKLSTLCNNHEGIDKIHPMILWMLSHLVFKTFEEFVDNFCLLLRRTMLGKT